MKLKPFIFFIVLPFSFFCQDIWTIMDSIKGAPRSVASSFVLNNQGYVLGGLDDEGFRRKMHSYNYIQDDWDNEASIGGPNGAGLNRGSASAFSIKNKGYVCLGQGQTNGFFKDLWEFDPSTETWSQKADFIGSQRRQAVGFAIDTFGYVGTGVDAFGFKKDMYKYDPSNNSWVQINDFGGSARKEAVGFAMGGQAYIGTGDDGVKLSDFWQYEPISDLWIQKANFPGSPRKGAVGWGIFPQAFISTGEDENHVYTNDLWEYNYYADNWIQRADFIGSGRSNAIAFVLNNVAYVGSGYNGVFLDDMYAYHRLLSNDNIVLNDSKLVYPNPSKEKATILIETKNLNLIVYSSNGEDVTAAFEITKNKNNYQLTPNNISPGNYIIKIHHDFLGLVYKSKIMFL
ncbi:MAG: T9SS type A sorting domain-containing protein [Crocinitomicaceae bacterium]|nr:T9SS type A sorting domain-containing protein [Crocinitomicaceae bacterium]